MNNKLLQNIDQDVAGIIWVTDGPITSQQANFKEIDYLLDGLILKELLDQKNIDFPVSLFLSKSFNQNFFVLHSSSNAKEIEKHLQNCPKSNRKVIKVLNNSSKEINFSHNDYTFQKL